LQALLVDLAAPGPDLPPAAPAAAAPEPFTALAWGTIGADGAHPVRERERGNEGTRE
jgi:hypothetical protein